MSRASFLPQRVPSESAFFYDLARTAIFYGKIEPTDTFRERHNSWLNGNEAAALADALIQGLGEKRFQELYGELFHPFEDKESIGPFDRRVINFYEGNSGSPPHPRVMEALRETTYPDWKYYQEYGKYTEYVVLPEYRQAIRRHYQENRGITADIADNRIMVGEGTGGAFDRLLRVVIDTNDIILSGPGFYHTFAATCNAAGADMRTVDTGNPEQGYKLQAEHLDDWWAQADADARDRLKLIKLYQPTPKTGAIYTQEELTALAQWAVDHDVLLACDEIFEDLHYNRNHDRSRDIPCLLSVEGLAKDGEAVDIADYAVVIGGISKNRNAIGLRQGWLVGPESLVKSMEPYERLFRAYQEHGMDAAWQMLQAGEIPDLPPDFNTMRLITSTFTPLPMQWAAIAAIEDGPEMRQFVDQNADELSGRMQLILERIDRLNELLACVAAEQDMVLEAPVHPVCQPEAGYTIMVDFEGLRGLSLPDGRPLEDTLQLFNYALSHGVGLSPGLSQGMPGLQMSLSYADFGHDVMMGRNSPEAREEGFRYGRQRIEEGFDRLEEAFSALLRQQEVYRTASRGSAERF